MSQNSASPVGWVPPGPGYLMDLFAHDGIAAVPGQGWKAIIEGRAVPVIAFAISSTYVSVLTWSKESNAIVQVRGELIPPS